MGRDLLLLHGGARGMDDRRGVGVPTLRLPLPGLEYPLVVPAQTRQKNARNRTNTDGDVLMKVYRAADIPDSHKIAVYDALCRHFAGTLDTYYTDPIPTDPRYDSGAAYDGPTECVGIEMLDDGQIGVVLAITGWADNIGFSLELPTATRDDQADEGSWIDVADTP